LNWPAETGAKEVSDMDGYTSKSFDCMSEAKKFAKSVKGVIEGPFLDWDLNREYIVFYKEVV
jgi:hypothetical protein